MTLVYKIYDMKNSLMEQLAKTEHTERTMNID